MMLFLLDGTRLNAVWGQHGQNGTIYATESEGFNQIICYKSSPYFLYGPDWFLVTAKDGTKMEFGNTTDSRIMNDAGEHPLLWRLNRILDINGNYIDFKYINTGRDSRIDEINYTGNINTGLLPNVKIKFIYGNRYETNTNYEGGASLSSLYLLNKIIITHFQEGSGEEEPIFETVKTYQFNYGFDNVHSLLKEVIESGTGIGNTPSLNSTIFLYGDHVPGINTSSTGVVGIQSFFSGDFNGDGVSDLLITKSYFDTEVYAVLDSQYTLKLGPGPNWTPHYNKSLPQGTSLIKDKKFYNFLTADYNKDGRDDVLEVNTSWSTTHQRRQFNNCNVNYTTDYGYSTGYFQSPQEGYIYLHPSSSNFLIPGDFNGDGNQDYILVLAKWISGTQFEYESFFTSPGTYQTNLKIKDIGFGIQSCNSNCTVKAAEANILIPIDFDGDGKTEILVTYGSQSYIYSIKETTQISGYSFVAQLIYTTAEIINESKVLPGDFNGDRKTDLLVRNQNGTWKILFSTGISFISSSFTFNQTVILSGGEYDHRIRVGDFNGDGKTDILHAIGDGFTNPSYFSVYYSKGTSSGFYYEQYSYNGTLPPQYNYNNSFETGDFNGDGRTDILCVRDILFGTGNLIYFNQNGQERLLQKVTDGHNTTTAFEYKLLTDKSATPYVYNRTIPLYDPQNQNPYNYVQLPMYVVSSVTAPDGIGGTNSTSFFYEDAVVHRAAKGFLGFRKITSKNTISGITSIVENQINTQFAIPYTVKQTTKLTATDELLSESFITNTFVDLSTDSNDKRYFQKIDKTLSVDHLSGTAAESVNTYDNYGNVTTNVSKVGAPAGSTVDATETTTTTTVFGIHNTPVPAKPDNITVSNTRTGMPAQSSTTTFTYTMNGLPLTQTVFYGLPKSVTTTYGYNSFGNLTQTVTSSSGLSNRVSAATYDSRGRFPLTKQVIGSSVTQKETFIYDGKWGKPLSQTSTDCLTTTFEYDIFGRLKKTNLPAGYSVNISLNWDIQGEQVFYSLTDYPGGNPDEKIWYDKAGREIKRQIAGFNNQWLTQLTTYDIKGNVATKTNACYSNETPLVTSNYFDVYNRPVLTATQLNSVSTTYTSLSGGKMQITVENSAGQNSSKIIDAAGKTISAIDYGGQLDFTYDSRGNQTEVKHGTTVLVTSAYDIYGRQTSLFDKNAGTITYEYDAYGQLTQQTDNIGNTYYMSYDDFGRLISRQGGEGTTTYEYFKTGKFFGCSNNNLSKVTGFNGVVKEYTYDNLRRLQSEKVTVDGSDYTTTYAYDTYGNVTNTTYPSGVVVNDTYDVNGGLLSVSGGDPWNPVTLFTANAVNGFGQYTNYTLGNGRTSQNTYNYGIPTRFYTPGIQDLNLTFNYNNGNLTSRYDAIKGLTENFQYDNLNRLTGSTVNSVQQLNLSYDGSGSFSMGNITSKTDAGNYVYNNNKIHAVAYITNPAGPTAPPVSHPSVLQQITYTPFLKTASISEGSVQTNFTYGPDYQRIKTEMYVSGSLNTRKYFFGDYEKIESGGTTRYIHYIAAGNGLCAVIEKYSGSNSIIHFIYTDYLGSLLTRTDINGNITAEQNFDAWGRQRNTSTWQYDGVGISPLFFDRGYTGHEHLPSHYLINMNGRMYDPIMGRMLSPDNYVPDPLHTQGYNRYTYANNNPLVYTDPDGNFIHIIIGALIGGIINLSVNAIQGNIHSFWDGLKSFGLGAIQGVLGAAIAYGGFGWGSAIKAGMDGFYTMPSIIGNIATGIGSSFLPTLRFGNNFSISPSFALSSHGLSAGLSVRVRAGDFSVGFGFAENSKGQADGRRFSYGIGWDNGKLGFSYSRNHFGGKYSQITGTYGIRVGRISGNWENDNEFFSFAGGDKWRTNGFGFAYSFKNGSQAFIGSRFMTGRGRENPDRPGYYLEDPSTLLREGLFYAGFTNAKGITTSYGVDWEKGRYEVMKFVHRRITSDKIFENLQGQFPLRGFFRYGNFNSFTYFW